MTEPQRARDVRVGDVLPDGSKVYHVGRGVNGYNIYAHLPDGSRKLRRYAPDTIIPGPEDRHPSRFEGGHPWDRKRRSTRADA